MPIKKDSVQQLTSLTSVATFEADVAQFVSAIRDANRSLAAIGASNNGDSAETRVNTTNPAAAIAAALEGEVLKERRAAFENMRREWMLWGKDLVERVNAALQMKDLKIAERMVLVGLIDRMAWYGVGYG